MRPQSDDVQGCRAVLLLTWTNYGNGGRHRRGFDSLLRCVRWICRQGVRVVPALCRIPVARFVRPAMSCARNEGKAGVAAQRMRFVFVSSLAIDSHDSCKQDVLVQCRWKGNEREAVLVPCSTEIVDRSSRKTLTSRMRIQPWLLSHSHSLTGNRWFCDGEMMTRSK